MRALVLLALAGCASAPPSEWRDAKFGMFIHWGIYSVPAGHHKGKAVDGVSEWIMHTAGIPVAEYEPYARQFNPVKFDARLWARIAKDAGMKYLVITSKHHDGFAMFDSKASDYNVVKATPWGRDPLKALAEACRDEGLMFGLYYSILDWHEPGQKGEGKAKYVAQMKAQLREIVTQYDPAILWFDGEWEPWWTEADGDDLEAYVRGLKPGIVLNDRVGKRGPRDGDYATPEQFIPARAPKRPWETCMTMNDSWGFKRGDDHWKSADEIVRCLAEIAGKGGNFLLNVGPTAEGEIPRESVEILEEVGNVLRKQGMPTRVISRAERSEAGEPIAAVDGNFMLWAREAAFRGETIQLERKCKEGNVGFWTEPTDYVEWFIDADGEYGVEVTYASAPGTGGEFEVRVGDAVLRDTTASTGSWETFFSTTIGAARAKGRVSVTVRAVKFKGAMMNLSGVMLTRVK